MACGAFVKNSHLVFHQNWSPVERAQSSTWRELKAVCLAFKAFANHFSDNQNIESILQNGSKKADLYQFALLALQICLKFHISLEFKWTPQELNARFDALSKLTDHDDYTINDAIFQIIYLFGGPHFVGRYACSYNAKIPRFSARFFQICCVAVDAFSQDCGHDNNWICPPVCLLIRVVKHTRE